MIKTDWELYKRVPDSFQTYGPDNVMEAKGWPAVQEHFKRENQKLVEEFWQFLGKIPNGQYILPKCFDDMFLFFLEERSIL